MTRLYAWVLTTALIFMGIASWLSPQLLSWYASPPVQIGVTCDHAMNWAMEKLIISQSLGLVAGMAVGLSVALWLRPKQKSQTEPVQSKA